MRVDLESCRQTETRILWDGAELLMVGLLMGNRIGTVEVPIRGMSEPTVSVVCHERGGSDVVPLIGHDLYDVGLGDTRVLPHRTLPLMKE